MIQLEVNGTSRKVSAGSTDELIQQIRQAISQGEVICVLRVNGIETSEARLRDFSVQSIQTVEVSTANPALLARESLGETRDWMRRISQVLEAIAEDFRLGRDREGAGRLIEVVDALQILVSLLQGIHACLDMDQGERASFDQRWKPAEADLRASIAGLVEDLELGDPVRLADRMGHSLPRSLNLFRDILHQIPA